MNVSKAYLILGMALIGGLTVAGVTAEPPKPAVAAATATGHEGHDHGDGDGAEGHEAHGGEMATYTFNGVVTEIDVEKGRVTIKHEKIGDYMEAMTMPFDVADKAMLDGLKVGDEKSFILHVNPSMTAIVGIADPQSGEVKAEANTDATAEHECAHKDGEKCEHEGAEGHAGGACCSKHANEKK